MGYLVNDKKKWKKKGREDLKSIAFSSLKNLSLCDVIFFFFFTHFPLWFVDIPVTINPDSTIFYAYYNQWKGHKNGARRKDAAHKKKGHQ